MVAGVVGSRNEGEVPCGFRLGNEGLPGQHKGARQETRRVAWMLSHTSRLPPASVWWHQRSRAIPFAGGMLLSSRLAPAELVAHS